ncbi:MAG: hypothetical protein IT249_10925 [Chitinophagaceae bacterium]|nr:hypothetical protein [Chitinophagaceae bacterium]
MKRQKQKYQFYTALFLLLSFAATQLPFELFHSHNTVNACAEKNSTDGICHHKTHIEKQERFCWACTIQVEKTFDLPSGLFNKTRVSDYTGSCIYTLQIHANTHATCSLRGPPSLVVTLA